MLEVRDKTSFNFDSSCEMFDLFAILFVLLRFKLKYDELCDVKCTLCLKTLLFREFDLK